MKFRRMLAAALCLSMGMGLVTPAMAAEKADDRLVKVTQAVKATLAVGDEYTDFYGEPNETYLGTRWELNWSGEDTSLHVSATEEGKVLSMSRGFSSDWRENKFGPSFPAMTQDQAKAKAEAFVQKVLTKGETAVFDDSWDSAAGLDVEQYGFGGTIYLNGLKTPMSFRVWVNVKQGDVTNFWRDDESGYAGSVPGPSTVTTDDKARALLRDTLELELIYVRDSVDDKAVLRYVPRSTDDFYVDASTGKLVNLTELREELYKSAAAGDAAAPEASVNTSMAADRNGLTQAELDGIAKLEGVKDKEELDKLVRAWKAFKLDGFELSGCSYSVERKDGGISPRPITVNVIAEPEAEDADETAPADAKVTAYLTYVKKVGNGVSRRNVTVDAKTGELKSMGGYNSYDEAPGKTAKAAAQKKGEAFLKELWGDQFGKCKLYTSTEAEERKASDAWVFTYAQKVNGYFFPENTITVRVSADDGSVMGFNKSFDDDVEFDSADGLIDLEAAKTAWVDSFPVELAYIAVPVKLDLLGQEVKPLINAGYSFYNALKPGYELGRRDVWYLGVDAKTGELVKEPETAPDIMTYDDVAGHWAETALTELAQYNVGWFGGKADPNGELTQIAYLALLLSADGYRYIPGEGSADDLYDYAVRRGLLTKAERDDDKVLTRGEMVKLLLDSLGYKAVANIPGIFRCDFADAAAIPAEQMGYAALAQGLGIISGGLEGGYAPDRGAIRAEGAVMLWKYMKR